MSATYGNFVFCMVKLLCQVLMPRNTSLTTSKVRSTTTLRLFIHAIRVSLAVVQLLFFPEQKANSLSIRDRVHLRLIRRVRIGMILLNLRAH